MDSITSNYDVLIIGGGINGAVSAASLSHRGYKVLLVERGDFACQTSQESSCLVWGGIKYLENWEFSLVWKLCRSRNHLMRSYPSSVKEIRFFVPYQKGTAKNITRLKPFIWMGTVLYWVMGRFFTKAPKWFRNKELSRQEPSLDHKLFHGAIEYSDAYLPDGDSRFVYRFIHKAVEYGAECKNYHEATKLSANEDGSWNVSVKDVLNKKSIEVKANFVLNSTGPWADENNQKFAQETGHRHELSKGAHLITERLGQSRRVITIFADDGRMFFVLPMGIRSCLGTTDTKVKKLPAEINDEDRHFILEQINERFALPKELSTKDVIAERCGVRPLAVEKRDNVKGDWTSLSRKHVLEHHDDSHYATIFGGKLTDCLNVGDEVYDIVKDVIGKKKSDKKGVNWYGEPNQDQKDACFHWFESYLLSHPHPPLKLSLENQFDILWRRYQADIKQIFSFNQVENDDFMPVTPGSDTIWAEIRYICKNEHVKTVEDVLRRRTFLSLNFSDKELKKAGLYKKIEEWIG